MSNISDPVRLPVQALRKSLMERKPCTFTPEAAMELTNLLLLSCDMIDDKCKQCKQCKQYKQCEQCE